MRSINRFIAWVVIVFVVVSILLAILAIAGSWLVNKQVTSDILYVLNGVQTGLSAVESSLQRLDTALSSARELSQTILSAADGLGERIEESSPVLDLLTKTVNEDLVSRVNAARETVIAIRDAVTAFNASLEAINALPFIEVPTLTDQLQSVSDRLADLALMVQELRGLVAQVKTGVVETLVTPITQTATRIDNELATVQATLQSYMQQVGGLQSAVATLQARVPVWIDIASVALSLFFLWIIIAELAMLAIARGYLRTGYLPWSYPQTAEKPETGRVEMAQDVDQPSVIAQEAAVEEDQESEGDGQAEENQAENDERM
jgi:uncharacterized phage infection (PIP) family protein YhgE